jgi:Dyp-type peroxidase family
MRRPPNLPRRAGKPADIDLADIQGNVLRGYTMPAAAYLFLRIVDVAKARALMARMLPQVVTAAPWPGAAPATAMNVAFTFAGLRALALPDAVLESFPDVFRADGTLPAAPVAPFERDGRFVVYRKLAMDVAAFRRYVAAQGEHYPGGARLLAAKIVGRWPDGTPLAVSPDSPDAKLSSDSQRINDFGYAEDPIGLRCPLGAHIRRTNPRDAEGFFDGRLSNRHRIVRRGRAYGRPLPPGMEDDGADRGLVFICFQADIWRQFETIQSLWVDDGDPFGLGRDKDFLIGEPHGTNGKMTIQGTPPFFLKPQPRFVTTRGGEYLFQPSMSALRRLAGLESD